MKITDCEFEKLLPLFMRNQPDDLAMARALDPVIRNIGEKIKLCSDWGVIDDLPEEFVDALAWELDVDWYAPKTDKTLDVKKELVKNADKVHKILGTKAAVESVAKDIFGNGTVEEWFQTGDAPGYFRVWIETTLNEENVGQFMKTIGQVKNTRSHLKAVTCRFTGDMDEPEIDPGSVITEYGETEIYGQIWYYAEVYEKEETDVPLFKIGLSFVSSEDIETRLSVKLSSENSEKTNAALVQKSEPCYFYNGQIRYNGSANYDSFYYEEDL